MAFSALHVGASIMAAVLTLHIALLPSKRFGMPLGWLMFVSALAGLLGFFTQAGELGLTFSVHSAHELVGVLALLSSLYLFAYLSFVNWEFARIPRGLSSLAAFLAAAALVSGFLLTFGISSGGSGVAAGPQFAVSSVLPELEASSFNGMQLTPLAAQLNNAIKGTQVIDRSSYRLEVTGLVSHPTNLSYNDLLGFPAYAEVVDLDCVEGWGFTAKWTGFRVSDLLNRTGIGPNASYVMFYSSDGYSTGLPLSYLQQNDILLAYGINDITLPPERGFPLQLVAQSKFGYKWAKWVTRIEVGDEEKRGYWESRGYSNAADVGGPAFG